MHYILVPEFPCWCRHKIHASVSGPIGHYGRHAEVYFMVLQHKCQTFQLAILYHVSIVLTGFNIRSVTFSHLYSLRTRIQIHKSLTQNPLFFELEP